MHAVHIGTWKLYQYHKCEILGRIKTLDRVTEELCVRGGI